MEEQQGQSANSRAATSPILVPLAAGGCGIIAGMFVGFFVWFVREPDRLMWAGFLAAGFVGGVVGALFTRINT
jgi:hypothetical protein